MSRVLHGHGSVRENTRARVRSAIDELGYVPDGAAQSLARNRKDVIGLVAVEHSGLKPDQYDIESMSLLFYDEVMRGVELRIRERNWSLLITFLREEETLSATVQEDEPVHSRLLALSGKVDGLLIGEGILAPPALAKLARRLPLVVVAGDTAQRGVDVVSADNWSGAHALVEHLVVGSRQAPAVPHRRPGDRAGRQGAAAGHASGHRGAPRHRRWWAPSPGCSAWLSGQEGTAAMLDAGGELPDALVCANDQMAIGALRDAGGARHPGAG